MEKKGTWQRLLELQREEKRTCVRACVHASMRPCVYASMRSCACAYCVTPIAHHHSIIIRSKAMDKYKKNGADGTKAVCCSFLSPPYNTFEHPFDFIHQLTCILYETMVIIQDLRYTSILLSDKVFDIKN